MRKAPKNPFGIDTDDPEVLKARMSKAIDLAFQYGNIDGDHHKQWLIDRMLRALLAGSYRRIIAQVLDEDDGEWHTGIAP